MKSIIKADKNCKYCRGRGFATSFIGGIRFICNCVTNQIEIRTYDDKVCWLKNEM